MIKYLYMKAIFIAIFITSVLLLVPGTVADELDDINSELENLTRDLEASRNATKPLEKDLERLTKQINSIKSRLNVVKTNIGKKERDIRKGERALTDQKKILDRNVLLHYKNIKKSESSLLNLLVSENFTVSLRNFFYQKRTTDESKQTVLQIALYIKNIEVQKEKLQSEKNRLAVIQTQVDKQSEFLSGEIGKARKYQAELSGKIASLTNRQQQLLAEKFGSLNLPQSLGAGPLYCTDDRNLDPGFGNAFAFYTYGIPHRVGMSQYGAMGRANAGQSAEEILSAYYANIEIKKDYSTDITINVDGLGSYNIEDYVKRIYEMPSSWPMEALKSQAVAARSYALSYTNNGASSICATQQCQVAKAEEKGGRWNEAVDATRGWVMLNNGSPITAWYASTAGGYTFQNNDVWGGSHRPWTRRMQDGSGSYGNFQDVINNAYDKDSPCMYAAQGWRNEYAKSAWLKNEEVADIVNVLMLAKADSGVQVHLSQTDKPNPDGQETWDASRVKQELKNRGIAPYNSISNISMGADFGIGRTTNVSVSGDVGTQSFSGDEFKNFLNLRAPANIQIVGPLFNVERR